MKKEQSWIKHARIFAFEAWWPPFWPHINIDWNKAHETMQRLELDTLQANALTKWALYPTKLVKQHPELNGRDLVAEAREFCDKHGYKMILYSLFAHAMPISTELSIKNPGIARPMFPDLEIKNDIKHMRGTNPAVIDLHTRFHFGDERYVAHCPFAMEEWLTEFTTEIAQRYEYEAAWLDGSLELGWLNDALNNVCTCHVCQKAYLEEFHRPMPLLTDTSDPRLFDLQAWNMRRLDKLLEKMTGILRKGTDMPIVGNIAHLTPITKRPEIVHNLQGGLFEHAPDGIELVRKASKATAQLETAIIYPDCYDPWPRKVTAGWEVENKGFMLLSYDATPYLAQPGKYYFDTSMDEPARRIFKFMKDQTSLLREQEEIPYCAVVSMLEFNDHESVEFHENCVRGWVRALMDSHLQVVDIPEYFLSDIQKIIKYPVLVIESLQYMEESYLKVLYQYVEQGGSLYIGHDNALFNCRTKRNNGQVLKDLFDISLAQETKESLARRDMFEGGFASSKYNRTYDVYASYDYQMCKKYNFPATESFDPCFLATMTVGKTWDILANSIATDNGSPLMPLFACKKIGQGKVLFSGAGLGVQYAERNDQRQAGFMKDIVSWLAGCKNVINVKGNREVFVRCTQCREGTLVYIVNNICDRQSKQQDWWEMKKVNEPPIPIGEFSLVGQGTDVKVLYGTKPDDIKQQGDFLQLKYDNLKDNTVLLLCK